MFKENYINIFLNQVAVYFIRQAFTWMKKSYVLLDLQGLNIFMFH